MEDNYNHGKMIDVDIAKEMRTSFLDYSMSVIVARALPDVRDGLKPVHRRILYSMNNLGMTSDKPHKKSARIVGDVIGKYHPHGDTAVYETMVRMAQEFSYRYPLVDGHGNFGSIDGDRAAAMRYTEARMSKISMEMLRDINKETVEFVDNYDGEETEPSVLPAKFPNLVVNGGVGIAVGMATNMPPHNLTETINATIAIMDNPDITIQELMENYITGPDFPTGAYILGRAGIKKAFETGRGSVIIRSKIDVEDMPNGKKRIIVREIPYQVNKSTLIEKIAKLVRDKFIVGITDLRDESNRLGIRIVMEIKKDIQCEVILNQLYRMTSLQTSFGVNNVVLVENRPMLLGMKDMLSYYIDHQIDVITKRTTYELKKAKERSHILEGLKIAIDNIDEIVHLIRNNPDPATALTQLMERFELSEIQAKAILDMQLRRLTGLERDKIVNEFNKLQLTIDDLEDILANHHRIIDIIKTELLEINTKFGDDRRSEILESDGDMEDEDLIPVEDIIITMTNKGYVKRMPVDTYRTQNRGGVGVKGMNVNENDVIDQIVSMSTHDNLLIFTNTGRVYRIKGYRIPSASRTAKGLPIVNLLNLDKNETIKTLLSVKICEDITKYLFFVTKKGVVKRVDVCEFDSIRQNGKKAITLREEDELLAVKATTGDDDIIIGAANGKAVRFHEEKVRPMGRTAAGVKGMNVDGSDVVGMACSKEANYILVISEFGYGKKTPLEEYRSTSRGVKGVKTIKTSEKNGQLVSLRAVNGDEDVMISTNDGVVIRISLEDVKSHGRATLGVRLIKAKNESKVSSIAVIEHIEEALEEKNDVTDNQNENNDNLVIEEKK
jgi:DNA gyrase subunit A